MTQNILDIIIDERKEEVITLPVENNPVKKIANILYQGKPKFRFAALKTGDLPSRSLAYFLFPVKMITFEEADAIIEQNPENAFLRFAEIKLNGKKLEKRVGQGDGEGNTNEELKIGDKIIMTDDAEYACTKEGSEGEVTKIRGGVVEVMFTKLTGDRCEGKPLFPIQREHLKKIEPRRRKLKGAYGEENIDELFGEKLKVGDEIIMDDGVIKNKYLKLKKGVKGKVTEFDGPYVRVRFKDFNKEAHEKDQDYLDWWILENEAKKIGLEEKADDRNIPYSLIQQFFPDKLYTYLRNYTPKTRRKKVTLLEEIEQTEKRVHNGKELNNNLLREGDTKIEPKNKIGTQYTAPDTISFIAAQRLCKKYPELLENADKLTSTDDLTEAIVYFNFFSAITDDETKRKIKRIEKKVGISLETIGYALNLIYPKYLRLLNAVKNKKNCAEHLEPALEELFGAGLKNYEQAALLSEIVNSTKIVKKLFQDKDVYRDLMADREEMLKNEPNFSGLFKKIVEEYFPQDGIQGFRKMTGMNEFKKGKKARTIGTDKIGWLDKKCGQDDKKIHLRYDDDPNNFTCDPYTKFEIEVKEDKDETIKKYLEGAERLNYNGYRKLCLDFSMDLNADEGKKFDEAKSRIENEKGDAQNFKEYFDKLNYLGLITKRIDYIYK